MKIEIITVGDEVISGYIANTNATFLANTAYSLGAKVTRIVSVGDNAEAITETIQEAIKRVDVILVTGGLGPTPDDLTSQAAAQALRRGLVVHTGYLKNIKEKFQRWNLTFTPSDEKQALLPERAEPLPNPIGVCGFQLEEGGKPLFFFPGVSREVKTIAQGSLIPFIREKMQNEGTIVCSSLFKVFGPTESGVKELLKELEGDFELAYLPSFPEIHLKLTVQGNNPREVEAKHNTYAKELSKTLGIYCFGKDNDSMEGVVGTLLREKGMTISVAESCTGGLIAHRITEIPGSSDYFIQGAVVYSNQAKKDLLGVPSSILEKRGPVSKETATLMAKSIRKLSKTTLGVATTGIAGPTGDTLEIPVGRVFIALAAPDTLEVKQYDFFGDRSQIKLIASEVSLDRVRRYLLSH